LIAAKRTCGWVSEDKAMSTAVLGSNVVLLVMSRISGFAMMGLIRLSTALLMRMVFLKPTVHILLELVKTIERIKMPKRRGKLG